ncbi:MAG TPA: hypothetical protein VK973_03320, partial [Arenicellales bacterium]|nr:hypothetical protein [Arenicellales bacterium]
MATYNVTGYSSGVSRSLPWQGANYPFVLSHKVDFANDFSTSADNTDVIQVLPVSAGWGVMYTVLQVVTACAGADTITCNVGITGDDPDGFDASVDLTSTGYNVSAVGTDADVIGSPQFFTSDDTIDIVLTVSGGDGGPISSGVIVLSALVIDHSMTDI